MAGEAQPKPCTFFLVRYVPDIVRDEGLNIGLFLYSPQEEYLDCLFTDDFRRVRTFHPQADLDLLRALPEHFEQQIKNREKELADYIREMQESYSNLIQVTTPRACLAADPQAELQSLFARYVGAPATPALEPDTRMRIKQRLSDALKRHGLLEYKPFEKRVPAAPWTGAGDPFTFDYGYRPVQADGKTNGHFKFIHALSFSRDNELAKALRWTFEKVRETEAGKGLDVHLSVVHENLLEPVSPVALSSRSILENEQVHFVPVAQVDTFAQSVRREMFL